MEKREPDILRRFIVLEGGDGTGTTTQLRAIDRALDASGIPHWTTFEPTEREEGALIRSILSGKLERDPRTIARLFAADRCEHVWGKGGIVERLEAGLAVVCDRYVLSSIAYQGAACGLELPLAQNSGFPLPGLLIYFDLPPAESLRRISDREHREIYEELSFQERVGEAYARAIELYAESPMRIVRVDASLPVEGVTRIVLDAVGRELGAALRPV